MPPQRPLHLSRLRPARRAALALPAALLILFARSASAQPQSAPLAGIFGFLKPYKRIAESLRAFRRLIRVIPDAKMILVGEAHPARPQVRGQRGQG